MSCILHILVHATQEIAVCNVPLSQVSSHLVFGTVVHISSLQQRFHNAMHPYQQITPFVMRLQAEAHAARAMWLGPPLDLKLEPVQGFDSMVARKVAEGATVNEVLCAFVSPGGRLAGRRPAVAGA